MSNMWKPSSQASPGFVYFPKTAISPQKSDTSDFLAFSDPQPSPNKFKPNNYSSPQGKQQWGTPKNYNHNRNNQYKQNRYSGHNNSFSPNKSNSNYNRSNSFNNNKFNTSRGDKSFNKNAFLHPSFMENPWAKLEERLRQKQIERAEVSENSDDSSNDEA